MSGDLIRRSDAIGAITNHCKNECYYREDKWCPQCQREEFQEAIKAVPSADRPQGEWIEVDDVSISCRCSVCGWEAHLYEDDVYGMPYCPNCGCRMKGADDDKA